MFYILVALAIAGFYQLILGPGSVQGDSNKITSSEFMQQLDEGNIEEFEIQIGSGVYKIRGEYDKETKKEDNQENLFNIVNRSNTTKRFETEVLGNDSTLERITKAAMDTHTKMTSIPESTTGLWLSFLPYLILMLPAMFIMFQMMQQGGGGKGVMNFGKSKTKDISKEKVKVRFDDVAGAEEEKQELVEVVEFLKNPKRFTALGARIPAGVLLEGPPGTGKTLLAKAVAGEAGVPFYSISGSEFVEMFVGVGASRVRDLFENAKKTAPSIIFIDEIDAVGRRRGTGMGGGNDEREQTLNQLLVELDGFEGNEGVICIAATNRSDVLDPALLRPGRFDRQILVGNPDVKGREAILRVHARNKKLSPDVDLKVIAQNTPGFSGADLENLLNEGALIAARFDHELITPADLDEAHDRVIAGPAKENREMAEKQRRVVAYHEAGHTIAGMVLSSARVVHKVTIVPRGRAGGYNLMLPKEDQYIVTKEELYEQVVGLLGGRAAEEIVFNQQSTGASNDFQQATQIVRSMVTEYGMSEKLGAVQYEGNHSMNARQQATHSGAYSEQIAYEIDQEVRRIVQKALEHAHSIINEHREQLNVIAEKLLEVETLNRREIESLFETGQMPHDESEQEDSVEKADSFEESKEKAALHDKKEHEVYENKQNQE